MTPKIPVLIKKGKLQFQPEGQNYIESQSDGWYQFTITKPKSSRTTRMNSYLWGVVYKLIAEETGYDDDQVHALMKQEFGAVEYLEVAINEASYGVPASAGIEHGLMPASIPKSTAKYTVEEMQEYWRKITQWSAEFLNLQIPEPNEVEL